MYFQLLNFHSKTSDIRIIDICIFVYSLYANNNIYIILSRTFLKHSKFSAIAFRREKAKYSKNYKIYFIFIISILTRRDL